MTIRVVYNKHGRRFSHPVEVELGARIIFKFEYCFEVIQEIKALEDARWDPEKKHWHAAASDRNMRAICILEGDYTIYEHYKIPLQSASAFDTPAMQHQLLAASWVKTKKRFVFAGDAGIGKTLSALLGLSNTSCRQPLVVAPHSALQQWKRELIHWGYHKKYEWRWSTYESLEKIIDLVRYKVFTPDFIILDESTKIKNPSTKRAKAVAELLRLCPNCEYVICLSGMIAPKNPTDWWNQIEVVCPGYIREGSSKKLGKRLGEWEKTGEYEKLTYWDENEVSAFAKRISPVVLLIRKKDVFDFPDKIYAPIKIPISEEYRQLARFWTQNEPRAVTLLQRLREVSDGFSIIQDDQGEIQTVNGTYTLVDIPNSPKELLLKERLEHYDEVGRIVISAAYRQSIRKIKAICEAAGWKVGLSALGVKPEISFLDQFQSDSEEKLAAVVHPECVMGLNFGRSPAIIVYSNTFNAEHRGQLLERCDRIGKDTNNGTIIEDFIHLESDQHVLDNLTKKISLYNFTVDEIKRWIV